MARAWGKTTADLPALQPVCIYEREVSFKGKKTIVTAWVLSLDPQFDYMRKAMYLESDAFIYTFDLVSQPERSLEYLDPFLEEAKQTLCTMPPQVLVGTRNDPTLEIPEYFTGTLREWMQKHGEMPYFEFDLTNKAEILKTVEKIFKHILSMVETNVKSK